MCSISFLLAVMLHKSCSLFNRSHSETMIKLGLVHNFVPPILRTSLWLLLQLDNIVPYIHIDILSTKLKKSQLLRWQRSCVEAVKRALKSIQYWVCWKPNPNTHGAELCHRPSYLFPTLSEQGVSGYGLASARHNRTRWTTDETKEFI